MPKKALVNPQVIGFHLELSDRMKLKAVTRMSGMGSDSAEIRWLIRREYDELLKASGPTGAECPHTCPIHKRTPPSLIWAPAPQSELT